MNKRSMSITFSSRFDQIVNCNESFDRGVLRVCYVGHNRNNSFISKDTFEKCMSSIYNCPIVCRYDRELDEIGSHDVTLVGQESGVPKLVNVTTPCGVIPESAQYWWEKVEEDDGTVHEYLCVDALLWKRQEVYKKIKADVVTNESMEITVLDGSMQDGVYVIERFEFTAFCLLGTAEPCYESASLLMFSNDDIKAQFNEMMRDFKESFSQAQPSKEVVIHSKNNMEGGEKNLDEKKNLMTQYGFNEEMLGFSLDDLSLGELKEKFEAMKNAETGNFALAEQFRDELICALNCEKVETCFGEIPRYWYVDYDNDVMEVYCYDQEDWHLYGLSYSMNGDHVVVDFESRKRKKTAIVDFDDGDTNVTFAAIYSLLTARFEENKSKWAEKYQDASAKAEDMESELNELRQFKSDIDQSVEQHKRDEIFAQFADLAGIPAFDELQASNERYSVDDLEEKCYAIRGRKQSKKFAFVGEPATPKLPIEKNNRPGSEPYGGVFAKYGISKN